MVYCHPAVGNEPVPGLYLVASEYDEPDVASLVASGFRSVGSYF